MSHKLPRPTEPELAILKALWENAPLPARALHEAAGIPRGWSLSSTRTTLARMVAKGLLSEAKLHNVTVYAPELAKTATLAGLVRDFMDRVLELKGPLPTSAFAQSDLLSAEEIEELRKLLDDSDPSETQDEP